MRATHDERGFALSPAGWAGVLLLAGAAALVLDHWLAGGKPEVVEAARPVVTPDAERAPPSTAAVPASEAGAAPTDREELGAPPVPKTAVELLAEHWGERWEEIRDRNRASKEWLERYPVSEFRSWEEVSELVLERALAQVAKEREGEDYLMLAFDRGLIDLAQGIVHVRIAGQEIADDFDPVRDPAQAHEKKLRAAWGAYWDELERVLATRWRAGEIEHHPILASYDPPPADALYVHSGIAHGWAYAIALRESEETELARLRAELESLRKAAFDELADLLGPE